MLGSQAIVNVQANGSKITGEVPAIEFFVLQSTKAKSSTMVEDYQRTPTSDCLFGLIRANRDCITIPRRHCEIFLDDSANVSLLSSGQGLLPIR